MYAQVYDKIDGIYFLRNLLYYVRNTLYGAISKKMQKNTRCAMRTVNTMNNSKKVGMFWFVLLLSFVPQILLAQPLVTSISGTVSDGQTITISGSSFGTNGPTVILFDDFEKGPNGTTISLTGPRIGAWTYSKSPANALYTSADRNSGTYAAEMRLDSGTSDVYGNLQLYDSSGWSEIFMTSWVKVPAGNYFPTSGQANWKLFWLDNNANWGGQDSTDLVMINAYDFNGQAITFGNSGSIVTSVQPGNSQPNWWNPSDPHMEQNVWTRFSFWIKGDPTNGSFHTWILKKGTAIGKKFSDNNIKTINDIAGANVWRYFSYNAWANSGATTYPTRPLFDDAYLAVGPYARARVEIGSHASYMNCTNMAITTPTRWSGSQITTTVRTGSFTPGQTAYLFVVDADGNVNSQGYPITIGGGSSSTDNPPTIAITSPTSGSTYSTTQNTVTLSGTTSDDHGISSVTWSNSAGGSGTATFASGSWSISSVPLQVGQNVITFTVRDTASQTSTATLTVTYSTTPPPVVAELSWNALDQTGDTAWKNSGVTYCVRLLVQGSTITKSAGRIQLGLQGRTSGSYTISRVSIAQRDTAAAEGNVVAGTWKKVTFDGRNESTWATDVVTVSAGAEKLSDEISFSLSPTKDYYVTFKINSPSVYLNPPSGYRELYFETADHTQDIQWAGTGFLTTQDYHALSGIYYAGPPTPTLRIQ